MKEHYPPSEGLQTAIDVLSELQNEQDQIQIKTVGITNSKTVEITSHVCLLGAVLNLSG